MLEARPRRGPGVREEAGQSRWFCGPNPGSRATSATRATGSRRSATFQSPKVERYREAMPTGDVLNWEAVAWAAAVKDSEPPLGEAKSHLAVSGGLPTRLHRTSARLGHLAKSKEYPVNPLPWGEPPGLRAGIRAGLLLETFSDPCTRALEKAARIAPGTFTHLCCRTSRRSNRRPSRRPPTALVA